MKTNKVLYAMNRMKKFIIWGAVVAACVTYLSLWGFVLIAVAFLAVAIVLYIVMERMRRSARKSGHTRIASVIDALLSDE